VNHPDPKWIHNRIRKILSDLEAIRENLLALSDDIWLSIDHNDNEALQEGIQFKIAYNQKLADFDTLTSELSAIVQQRTRIHPEDDEQTGVDDAEHNKRITEDLNRDEPHALDENFTYKRPYGFILQGQATKGITTWRRLFELICRQLRQRDPDRFKTLADHPDLTTARGHPSFSRDPDHLRASAPVGDGIHAEINLSANGICDTIRRLLIVFDIPPDQLQLFLRENRNAEPTDDA